MTLFVYEEIEAGILQSGLLLCTKPALERPEFALLFEFGVASTDLSPSPGEC